MSLRELEAEMDAAFIIECASSPSLRSLINEVGRDATYRVWTLGYVRGKRDTLESMLSLRRGTHEA